MIRRRKTIVLLSALLLAGAMNLGCEHHRHHDGFARGDSYVVQPGYYYDKEYRDRDGHDHGRNIYYYDGKRWDQRDRVPDGFTARERVEARDRQDRHDRHDSHDAHDAHDTHDLHDDRVN